MTIQEFKQQFLDILNTIENTNYSNVAAQFKMIALTREFYLLNPFITKEEIIDMVCNLEYPESNNEARIDAFGEFTSNIRSMTKAKNIFDDLGQGYSDYLFRILNYYVEHKTFFAECNS